MPISKAIAATQMVRFHYSLGKDPGYRLVEPHMIAYTHDGNRALSAWYLSGASDSNEGPGWRIYLMSGVSQIQIQPRTFAGPRPGYQADGGKSFHMVECALRKPLQTPTNRRALIQLGCKTQT